MIASTTPLLTRLRRLHGAWGLCVFVLLFKLAAGTLCLADGPSPSLTVDASTLEVSVQSTSTDAARDGGDCVLGEAGGCHCACAHAVPLSGAVATGALAPRTGFDPSDLSGRYAPAPPGFTLRPPIA